MKIPIEFDIGFADGSVVGYTRNLSSLTLTLKAWNDDRLRIEFTGVLGLRDLGVGDVSDLCEESDKSVFMEDAIASAYEVVPEEIPYKLFRLLDLDDQPMMEIVAADVKIAIEK
jgi:hypothetical protein